MRSTRTIVLGGAAAVSAAALVLGGAVAASAHGSEDRKRGEGRHSGPLASLVQAGTISQDEATAIRQALKATHDGDRAARQAERDATMNEVLAGLVAGGTLTQAQADAIAAADRGGMRDLIASGTVDRDDLQAVKGAMRQAHESDREAHQAERADEREAALSKLVSEGTLTQSQADAVSSALQTAKANRWKGMRGEGKRGEGMRGAMKGARA